MIAKRTQRSDSAEGVLEGGVPRSFKKAARSDDLKAKRMERSESASARGARGGTGPPLVIREAATRAGTGASLLPTCRPGIYTQEDKLAGSDGSPPPHRGPRSVSEIHRANKEAV